MRIFKKFLRILAILLPCLVGVLLFTNNSYATTVSCDTSNLSVNSSNYSTFSCDTSSLDSSKTWYYYGDITFDPDNNYSTYYLIFCNFSSMNGNSPICNFGVNSASPSLFSNTTPTISYLTYDFKSFGCGSYCGHFSYVQTYNASASYFTLNIADDISFSSGGIIPSGSFPITQNGTYNVTNYAEAVVDIPPEPGDYDDEFDGVITAIYICGASAIMIYFFYIIYGIFIKPTGGQK